ncbi:MAG: AAA family ATPase [Flavobacteriales bacterium]
MKRFAITGPESSGKTTLASALAEHYNAAWIPELARAYLTLREGRYDVTDLATIALEQFNRWKVHTENLVFCDTDMTVVKIWSEFKFGTCSPAIHSLFAQQEFEHYFLCRPDMKWEDDPLREHPEQREELFKIYLNELSGKNLPFTVLEGSLENRLSTCERIISGK